MKNLLFMAVAKGKQSIISEFKRYTGVAPCFIKGFNPNKAQLEQLYGNSLEEEPKYIGEIEVSDGSNTIKIANVRISFLALPNVEKVGVELKPISVPLFIQNRYKYNRDKTKVQVIDKYGRTAWVTIDQCKNHEIPIYSNGPANLDKDYRPAYVGEAELTNFLISYLNIPDVMKYDKNKQQWYLVEHPEESECRLDHISDYFKGDFSELEEIMKLQPENEVKILFGVRTDNEGRQYQTAFTQMFLKNSVSNYNKLDAFVQERKNAGAYATTDFKVGDFKEYVVESTPITETSSDPFAPSTSSPWG